MAKSLEVEPRDRKGASGIITGATTDRGSADGPNPDARFGDNPLGGTVDDHGVVYVTDSGNHTVRVIAP